MAEKTGKQKPASIIDKNNPEFSAALSLLENTSSSVFLTGKAGTGKSTFLRHITAITKKKYVVLAPTGIAAVNVGGQTLHSFFKIPLKPLLPQDPDLAINRLRQRLKYSKSHIKLLKSLELIIIDEISMVRADVIDFIDKILRVYSGNMRRPFGGKQMLFVGDVFQLEPVVTGNDRDVLSNAYSSFYFFNANVFSEIQLVPIELSKVYRQEDSYFVSLLDNIRMGRPTQANIDCLNSRYKRNEENTEIHGDFTMTIATKRDMVDAINEKHLAQLTAPSVVYTGTIEGDFPTNSLPTDLNLELKNGAQVVFVKNDPERRWVNGTVAVVESCLPDSLTVRTEDGEVHEVEIERWSNVKYEYNERTHKVDEIELGAFMQYPLKPAWALTIHKSQGLTFNNVIIDIGRGAFAGGQTYVALSRCRSLEGITLLNPISHRDIYVKPDVAKFASRFNNAELIESALTKSRADNLFVAAAAAFKREHYADAFMLFTEAVSLQPDVMTNPAVQRLLAIKSLKINAMNRRIAQLESEIRHDREKFEEIAAGYVRVADELGSEGWEADAAMKQYDKALEIAPDYPPALLGKAEVLVKTGRADDADSLYRRYVEVAGAEAWRGFIGLGDIAEADGDEFAAISSYLAAHDKSPKSREPLERLVRLYTNVNDTETAEYYKRKLKALKTRRKSD